VDQPGPVRRVQRRCDLPDDPHRPPGLERTFAPEQPGQIFALDEAHVDEQPVVDLAEAVDGDDVLLPEAAAIRASRSKRAR
jgi:hypothetical protein